MKSESLRKKAPKAAKKKKIPPAIKRVPFSPHLGCRRKAFVRILLSCHQHLKNIDVHATVDEKEPRQFHPKKTRAGTKMEETTQETLRGFVETETAQLQHRVNDARDLHYLARERPCLIRSMRFHFVNRDIFGRSNRKQLIIQENNKKN